MTGKRRVIADKKRHMYGWVKDRPDHRDAKLQVSRFKSFFLPKKVDLRPQCSPVENQGEIGSCTANATTSAVEFLLKKMKQGERELSRLFLYYATRVWVAGDDPTSDNGAMIRDVMKAMASYGTCTEEIWPYDLTKFSNVPSPMARAEAKNRQILHYYRCQNLRAIKGCLAEGYPVVGGFSVPESIEGDITLKTGFVLYPLPKENFIGGHAVLIVGYDDRKKLLTFQNSWGTEWGDKGFGYLPYAYVDNWLANDFWTIRRTEH